MTGKSEDAFRRAQRAGEKTLDTGSGASTGEVQKTLDTGLGSGMTGKKTQDDGKNAKTLDTGSESGKTGNAGMAEGKPE